MSTTRRVFLPKYWTNYLGEWRPIHENFISEYNIVPSPTPSVTPTLTVTPSVTGTMTPICPEQINLDANPLYPELSEFGGVYNRVYSYTGGSFSAGYLSGSTISGQTFFTGSLIGNNYTIYQRYTGGTNYYTIIVSRVGTSTPTFRVVKSTGDYIYNLGGNLSGSTEYGITNIIETSGGLTYPARGSGVGNFYISYPSLCPSPTPSVTPTLTPTKTLTPTPTPSATPACVDCNATFYYEEDSPNRVGYYDSINNTMRTLFTPPSATYQDIAAFTNTLFMNAQSGSDTVIYTYPLSGCPFNVTGTGTTYTFTGETGAGLCAISDTEFVLAGNSVWSASTASAPTLTKIFDLPTGVYTTGDILYFSGQNQFCISVTDVNDPFENYYYVRMYDISGNTVQCNGVNREIQYNNIFPPLDPILGLYSINGDIYGITESFKIYLCDFDNLTLVYQNTPSNRTTQRCGGAGSFENCVQYVPCPTPSVTPSMTPTNTITPSITPTNTLTPSVTPTNTLTPSVTPTEPIGCLCYYALNETGSSLVVYWDDCVSGASSDNLGPGQSRRMCATDLPIGDPGLTIVPCTTTTNCNQSSDCTGCQ